MFPHPCGDAFAEAVAQGADPATVVPDDYIIVRGGLGPIPAPATQYSAFVGPTLQDAAAAAPHGQIRVTTAGEVRRTGGIVIWYPEHSRRGTLNRQHVHVTEDGSSALSPLQVNPVPKQQRIDAGQ